MDACVGTYLIRGPKLDFEFLFLSKYTIANFGYNKISSENVSFYVCLLISKFSGWNHLFTDFDECKYDPKLREVLRKPDCEMPVPLLTDMRDITSQQAVNYHSERYEIIWKYWSTLFIACRQIRSSLSMGQRKTLIK